MVSADRQALAAAIDKRTRIADEFLRIRAAQEPARLRTREAEQALEAAELALREARSPEALVAGLLDGRAPDIDASAVTVATNQLDMAHRISRALTEREDETQRSLEAAAKATREAAVRVIHDSPQMATLAGQLDESRRVVAMIRSIGMSVAPGAFPGDYNLMPWCDPAEASAAIHLWWDALEALENDASTQLPTTELCEGRVSPSPSATSSAGILGGSSAGEVVAPNGRAA